MFAIKINYVLIIYLVVFVYGCNSVESDTIFYTSGNVEKVTSNWADSSVVQYFYDIKESTLQSKRLIVNDTVQQIQFYTQDGEVSFESKLNNKLQVETKIDSGYIDFKLVDSGFQYQAMFIGSKELNGKFMEFNMKLEPSNGRSNRILLTSLFDPVVIFSFDILDNEGSTSKFIGEHIYVDPNNKVD